MKIMKIRRKRLEASVVRGKSNLNNNFIGTNGSGTRSLGRHRFYTADNVRLKETAVNKQIARVKLYRSNLLELQKELSQRKESRRGRKKGSKNKRNVEKTYPDKSAINRDKMRNSKYKMPYLFSDMQEKMREKLYQKSFQKTETSTKMPAFYVSNNNLRTYKKQIRYYLQLSRIKQPQDGKLNYDFNKLIKDVKTMKLPAPYWKIRIIIKKKCITRVVCTDTNVNERSVTFSVQCQYYSVLINNKPVLLLGAPSTVDNVSDLEILLDVVQNISPYDQMILYK